MGMETTAIDLTDETWYGDLAGIGLVLEAQQHKAVRLAASHRLADDLSLIHI